MIIAGDKFGQLANRLFKVGHLFAAAIENNVFLIYPHFDDYKKYFQATETNDFGGYKISIRFHKNPFLNRIIKSAFIAFNFATKYAFKKSFFHRNITGTDRELDLDAIKQILKSRLTILNGWNIRDRKSFNKHKDKIRKIFQPAPAYQKNIERFFNHLNGKPSFLVGVHIRHGDYKNWVGGKYYYPFETYAAICRQINQELSAQDTPCTFIIFSDDQVDMSLFEGLECVKGPGQVIEDLYAMSRCNLIIGPPSTFSMWASFYGSAPLYHVEDPGRKVSVRDFKVHSE